MGDFTPFCVFEPPLGGLGAMYDDHLSLIGKRLPKSVNWTFSQVLRLRCYEHISVENRLFHSNGASWPKISGRRVQPEISDRKGRPHQSFFFSEN